MVGEHGTPVRAAVGVGVFKNHDAVAQPEVEFLGAVGVGKILGDPEAPAGVPGHRDRISHVGLGGEDIDAKARRRPETSRGGRGGQRARRRPLGIVRDREIVAASLKRAHAVRARNNEETILRFMASRMSEPGTGWDGDARPSSHFPERPRRLWPESRRRACRASFARTLSSRSRACPGRRKRCPP